MPETLEQHLRDALAALMAAREALVSEPGIDRRQVVQREIAGAQTSVGRALHLVGGQ